MTKSRVQTVRMTSAALTARQRLLSCHAFCSSQTINSLEKSSKIRATATTTIKQNKERSSVEAAHDVTTLMHACTAKRGHTGKTSQRPPSPLSSHRVIRYFNLSYFSHVNKTFRDLALMEKNVCRFFIQPENLNDARYNINVDARSK